MDKQFSRKLFHLISGIIIALLIFYSYFNSTVLLFFTLILLVASLAAKRRKIPFFSWMFNKLGKESERNFPGKDAITFLAGMFFTTFIFQKDIAAASIIILAIGDPVAYYVGKHHGKMMHPLGRKTVEGTLAGILTAFLAATFFVTPIEAAIAAVVGMAAEAISEKYDNITIPISAGLVLWIIRIIS